MLHVICMMSAIRCLTVTCGILKRGKGCIIGVFFSSVSSISNSNAYLLLMESNAYLLLIKTHGTKSTLNCKEIQVYQFKKMLWKYCLQWHCGTGLGQRDVTARHTKALTELSIWLYRAMSLCRVLNIIMATIPDRNRTITNEFMILELEGKWDDHKSVKL